jgi:hypothetical protein
MTVATETLPVIGEVHGIHVDDLKFGVNARYGWAEGNVLEAYKPKIEELRQQIEQWGFKKAHYIEYYIDGEGNKAVLNGNRRTYASKWYNKDHVDQYAEDAVIADDLPAGHIYAARVEKPVSVAALAMQQVSDNTQLESTKLDQLMVYQLRVDEILTLGEAKTANNAVKLIAKQDFKVQAEKLIGSEGINSIEGAYKSLKKELTTYETNLKKDLRVMTLSPEILSWLQESYLDASDIKLSFGKINELLTEYADKADFLLKEALKEVTLEPRPEYSQNQYLSSQWLTNLAKKLGLVEEETPKKPPKPPAVTTSDNNDGGDESGDESGEGESFQSPSFSSPENPEKPKSIKTGNIQTKGKKASDYYFLQAQKVIGGDLGLSLVSNDYLLQEPEPGIYTVTIDLPSKDLAQQFESFMKNIKAAFGDSDAIAELAPEPDAQPENEKIEEEEKAEEQPTEINPLDDVILEGLEY